MTTDPGRSRTPAAGGAGQPFQRTPAAADLRLGALSLLVGSAAFIVHIVLRSVVTAVPDPTIAGSRGSWVPINALGVVGSILVLLGLPAMNARIADSTGRSGLIGMMLIAVAWIFFGVFLSLYGMLVLPWLAAKAPALVAGSAAPPAGFVVTLGVGLLVWLVGATMLGRSRSSGGARGPAGSGTCCQFRRSGSWSVTWSSRPAGRRATW